MWHLYVLFVFYSVWKLVENHLGNSILSNLILGNPGLKIDFALPERNVFILDIHVILGFPDIHSPLAMHSQPPNMSPRGVLLLLGLLVMSLSPSKSMSLFDLCKKTIGHYGFHRFQIYLKLWH